MPQKYFRYSSTGKTLRKIYRSIVPVPHTTYPQRTINNICEVTFFDPKRLERFFINAVTMLRQERGGHIGDYLEFGVFNGTSMACAYHAVEKLGATAQFFGFDAFEGLPPGAENDDGGVWREGLYKCTFEQMLACVKKRGMDPDRATWIKGWYDETLSPDTAQKYGIANPGIIFVDCDTYGSSKAVLDFVGPLIKNTTILCLDDWKINDLDIKEMGEYRSFNEFLAANQHLRAREIRSYSRESKSFVISM